MSNREIARQLTDYAHFLESRRASLYRVKAYRRAAQTVLELPFPIRELCEDEGRKDKWDENMVSILLRAGCTVFCGKKRAFATCTNRV